VSNGGGGEDGNNMEFRGVSSSPSTFVRSRWGTFQLGWGLGSGGAVLLANEEGKVAVEAGWRLLLWTRTLSSSITANTERSFVSAFLTLPDGGKECLRGDPFGGDDFLGGGDVDLGGDADRGGVAVSGETFAQSGDSGTGIAPLVPGSQDVILLFAKDV